MNFKLDRNESKRDFEFEIPEYLKHHPFINYLKIYQNQHKVIYALYQGLIFSFTGFLILISFLIYNALDSSFIPWWGVTVLGLVDTFLLVGVIKAVYELKQYRQKSRDVLVQMLNFLHNDNLDKVVSTQTTNKQDLITEAKKKFTHRIELLTGKKIPVSTEPYSGWDVQHCPRCNGSFEMTKEECPFCHHKLGPVEIN